MQNTNKSKIDYGLVMRLYKTTNIAGYCMMAVTAILVAILLATDPLHMYPLNKPLLVYEGELVSLNDYLTESDIQGDLYLSGYRLQGRLKCVSGQSDYLALNPDLGLDIQAQEAVFKIGATKIFVFSEMRYERGNYYELDIPLSFIIDSDNIVSQEVSDRD